MTRFFKIIFVINTWITDNIHLICPEIQMPGTNVVKVVYLTSLEVTKLTSVKLF